MNLFTWNCFFAIQELLPQFIAWPDRIKRPVISYYFKRKSGFLDTGIMDGFLFPFRERVL